MFCLFERCSHGSTRKSQSLASRGTLSLRPTPPLRSPELAHGPSRHSIRAIVSDPAAEMAKLREKGSKLRQRLLRERAAVAARLDALDRALATIGGDLFESAESEESPDEHVPRRATS